MKIRKHLQLLLAFITIFTTIAIATSDIPNNLFNLSTENTLNNHYSAEIQTFWQENAVSSYFQGIDNKKIHQVAIVSGKNKAIVIAQGRNESVFKYKEVAYDFYQQGYDVYLIDHRGQGFSERFGGDKHRGYVHDFQDYVADFNQYVLSLELDKKYQHRYLVSHSMGGAISALYLQQYNSPFQASAFFSPMLSINLGGLPSFLAKAIAYSSAEVCSWFSDKACYVPGGDGYVKKSFVGNDLTNSEVRFAASHLDFEKHPETQLGSATMRWLATSISATEQAIDNADKITIPIILIQAGHDTVVTNEGQQALFSNVTYCKSNQFLTIENAKHEILLERDEYRLKALNNTLQFFSAIEQGNLTCIK